MTTLASILKAEITRLARKELKKELEGLRKAVASHRTEIAAAKKRILELERQVNRLEKRKPTTEAAPEATTNARFSAKGFASKRAKLGLSAADLGTLLGVSAQSVYNWESGKTQPRKDQIEGIVALRKMGKRQAMKLLEKPAE